MEKKAAQLKMPALPLKKPKKEEARMKYINANTILPAQLIEQLQQYIQGGYLYVPAKQGQRKHWGELTGYRKELKQRNQKIKEKHRQGASIESLSTAYSLSDHAIKKIIYTPPKHSPNPHQNQPATAKTTDSPHTTPHNLNETTQK